MENIAMNKKILKFGKSRILIYSTLAAIAAGSFFARAEFVELRQEAAKFTTENKLSAKDYNAIQHSLGSAILTEKYGTSIAKFMGYGREFATLNSPKKDRYKDLWNNSMGRQIANFSKETGIDRDKLLLDAYKNGMLILNEKKDKRAKDVFLEFPTPKYKGPSKNWKATPKKQTPNSY